MAQVNTKFIANPSFGVSSVAGQALTLAIDPFKEAEGNKYVGFAPVYFDTDLYNGITDGLLSVTPGCTFTDPAALVQPTIAGKTFFQNFVRNNPIHVTKMNVRASAAVALPNSIEVLTPNVFSGQMDRQIVNVTADSNMYQNQSNIVTLNCDIYLCRESIIVFNCAMSESTAPSLAIDVTFDKYLSLEKALVENYQILTTTTGMAAAINEEVANINAQVAQKSPVMVEATATPFTGAQSVQPAATKGNNFMGGSPYQSVQPLFTRGNNY